MEICLGEYNFGGGDNVTGGLAQCDVFGILARESVDLAFIWYSPAGSQQWAWQLFRSYDGRGSGFGEQLLKARQRQSRSLLVRGPAYGGQRRDHCRRQQEPPRLVPAES